VVSRCSQVIQHARLTLTAVVCCWSGLQEAGTRAIEADEQQRSADALKLYRTALEVIAEALALQVCYFGVTITNADCSLYTVTGRIAHCDTVCD
jgi:hypothetical protein